MGRLHIPASPLAHLPHGFFAKLLIFMSCSQLKGVERAKSPIAEQILSEQGW